MPESVLRLERRKATALDKQLAALREEVIAAIPPYKEHGPLLASTCYVWPSSACPVGCGHCNYAAPKSLAGLNRYSIAKNPKPVVDFMNTMGLWKAVLSGGGEPMVEPEFCAYFIEHIDSPNLAEIELITSAHFGTDAESTEKALDLLVEAWRNRHERLSEPKLTIRISLDWFHAERIGVEPAAQVIEALNSRHKDVGYYVRSVLLENDQTIENLAARLNAELSDMEDYQRTLRMPDGSEFIVYLKNLIVDGRLSANKLSRLPVGLPTESKASEFGKRFLTTSGKHIPARTYNGPQVKHLDGLACLIEDNGKARILEGNDVGRSADIREFKDWPEAAEYLYRDPITVFLVEHGPLELAALLSGAYPEASIAARDTNQLYHLTEILLNSPEKQLYATLAILENHILERRVPDISLKFVEDYRRRLAKLTGNV